MNPKELRALMAQVGRRTQPYDRDLCGAIHTVAVVRSQLGNPLFPAGIGGIDASGVLATFGGVAQFEVGWRLAKVVPDRPTIWRRSHVNDGLDRVLLYRQMRYLEFQLVDFVTDVVRGGPRPSCPLDYWAGLPSWEEAKQRFKGRRHGEHWFRFPCRIDFHIPIDSNRVQITLQEEISA